VASYGKVKEEDLGDPEEFLSNSTGSRRGKTSVLSAVVGGRVRNFPFLPL
jgi:hypothetical protein